MAGDGGTNIQSLIKPDETKGEQSTPSEAHRHFAELPSQAEQPVLSTKFWCQE